MRTLPAILLVLAVLAPAAAGAQDVEMLAEHYGTRVPDAYLRLKAQNPRAFEFNRGRAARMQARLQLDTRQGAGPQLTLGPREGTVTGVYRVPVVLGLFSDTEASTGGYSRDEVQAAYFSGQPGTITGYYSEVSGSRVTLEGDVQDWVRAAVTRADATGGASGLGVNTVGPFIVSLLDQLPPDIDWGLYDDDGPDGVPNSGDDDGFVDVLAVIHPTKGAECDGATNLIWSHRWSLSSSMTSPDDHPYTTQTPAANGGFIKVDDYVVEPVYACDGTDLNEIGTFTHELGHAFGLPDLYDTVDIDGKTAGAGNWDLMATGSWGCDGQTPSSPCQLSAWSKAQLGWVDVVDVAPDTDLGTVSIPPVETSGVVYRLPGQDGSGEYYLLENRQRVGFDSHLPAAGLLVWQINPTKVARFWTVNAINGSPPWGVWLREADGRNDLVTPGAGRGEASDVFPLVDNTAFHAATTPASRSYAGTPLGTTLLDITRFGQDVTLRLSTRMPTTTLSTEGGSGQLGPFTVDGSSVPDDPHTFTSAPFTTHELTAAAGELISEGVRRPFVGWSDDAEAGRARTVTTGLDDAAYVARYGGEQVQLAVTLNDGVDGVTPATFVSDPPSEDLWYADGTQVTLQVVPRTGFAFLQWTGALAGQPNPAVVTMNGPLSAGADFQVTYKVPTGTVSFPAAQVQNMILKPDNGTPPFRWTILSGTPPDGVNLDAFGGLTGTALEVGTFPVDVEVKDAIGLTGQGTVTLDVGLPEGSVMDMAGAFLLSSPAMDKAHQRFFDAQGNQNGSYDLGDFRAWVLAHPEYPLTAPQSAVVTGSRRTVIIPLKPEREDAP
ncbi:MAG: M6 family metalloprotease domain-containing protein [Gemmatimonadota bacterium]|jgi:M6 family metalloprotease-like protein